MADKYGRPPKDGDPMTEHVSFRTDEDTGDYLDYRAEVAGTTRSDVAREIIVREKTSDPAWPRK